MMIVKKRRKAVSDHTIVDSSLKKQLLIYSGKIGPDLERGPPQKRTNLILIHRTLPLQVLFVALLTSIASAAQR
jgi:hypothetical protein